MTNAQTNGAFIVVELVAQPGGGPPLHTHTSSESFTIVEGQFQFSGLECGQPYSFLAGPGDTVYIPGGAPHTYMAVGDVPGKTMLVLAPGLEMERFFAEAGTLVTSADSAPSGPPDIPALLAIGHKHGLVFFEPGVR
jgi:quercetin dioxygenase-like cupin family protein